ncbi:hypothetical protein EXS56_01570 [Candidatus Kaiserbacteria bacterium]|nr:hypothetical protein [Candidatus Kaiserbacteria bacterium]
MRFLRDYRASVGVLVFVGFALLGLASRGQVTSMWQSYRFESAMQSAVKCSEGTNVITCARSYIKTLMATHPARDILDELSSRVPPIQCHYLGHIIGQELYRHYQTDELALNQCNASCEFSCTHGVVGEAFMVSAGISEDDFDTAHLSGDELWKIGTRLCETGSCHGVGHAVFQAYHSFSPALALCNEIASGVQEQRCARGIFMEYSNIIAARSVWENATTTSDIDSLYATCSKISGKDREACYFFFPGLILGALQRQYGNFSEEEKITTMQHVCDDVPAADRNLCVSGVGVHFYSYLLMNSPVALRICEAFSGPRDQAACAFGMLSMSLETGDREEKFAYCEALSNLGVRQSCYQSIFHIISDAPGEIEKAQPLCMDDVTCLKAAAQSARNPFEYIATTVE